MSDTSEREVILPAVNPDDPIELNSVPDWFEEALENGKIEPVGSYLKDSDWMYFKVVTAEGDEYCRGDGVIGINEEGELYVRKNR